MKHYRKKVTIYCALVVVANFYSLPSSAGKLSNFEPKAQEESREQNKCVQCEGSQPQNNRQSNSQSNRQSKHQSSPQSSHQSNHDSLSVLDFFDILFGIIDLLAELAPDSGPVSSPQVSGNTENKYAETTVIDGANVTDNTVFINESAEAYDKSSQPSTIPVNNRVEPELPKQPEKNRTQYLRLNVNSQKIDKNINGLDFSFENRVGLLGFEFRHTGYRDNSENERLNYDQLQGFYRMTPANQDVAVDLGVGYGMLKGNNRNEGVILSMPVTVNAGGNLGFELRPSVFSTNNANIKELDIAVLVPIGQVAVKVGYRVLSSPNADIEGPYAGLDLLF